MAVLGNEDSRGSGCNGRVLIGVVIALISLASYYFTRQENPVTHEVQHISLSPGEEIALGLNSAPEMARQMGGVLPEESPEARQMSRVGHYLVEHSVARTGPWQYDFHLLADPRTINAFALPGGQIFMTRGLYDRLTSEAQIAGVLGHECGHVIERHSAQQMAQAQRDNMLVVATGVGTSSDRDNRGQWGTAVASLAAQMSQLHYSRADESQADQWGLRIMSEAGYDPRGMAQVMEVLQDASRGSQSPEFLQTHPYPEHRLEAIHQWIAEKFPAGVPSSLKESIPGPP